MAGRVVELRAAHVGVAVDEHALPRHLHVVEIDQRVVLVEARRDRIVEHRHRGRLVGLARQHAQAFGVHRQRAGEGEVLLAGLQRLQVGDEHLVRHDRTGAEHLGAADGDAAGVLVDDARDQVLGLLAPVLAALGLRIDDHVGEEVVVAARLLEIIRAAPWRAPAPCLLEHLDAHALADQRRGEMIRRAAHEAVGQRGPGLQRLAPLHHLGVVARHLPGAVDAAVRAFGLERHQLDVFRLRLEVVEHRRPTCTELRNAGCSVTSATSLPSI